MKTVDANNGNIRMNDRRRIMPPDWLMGQGYYRQYQSIRNALLDVQSELNRMPLRQLGVMYSRAHRMAKSEDPKDREFARIFAPQVLLAMDPANDTDREED